MSNEMILALIEATGETLYMVFVSVMIAGLFGIPLGILTHVTQKDHILSNKALNRVLNLSINVLRSIPFIILMVAIIPFTRFMTGTSIGTTAAIVPLAIGAIPLVARMIDNVFQEVPYGLIEAGRAFGATPFQLIYHILVSESIPGIINVLTVTTVTLIGYSAMAGAVGGGGLGDLAIRYGYERFDAEMMLITVVVLVVMVQVIQAMGDFLVRYFSKK